MGPWSHRSTLANTEKLAVVPIRKRDIDVGRRNEGLLLQEKQDKYSIATKALAYLNDCTYSEPCLRPGYISAEWIRRPVCAQYSRTVCSSEDPDRISLRDQTTAGYKYQTNTHTTVTAVPHAS